MKLEISIPEGWHDITLQQYNDWIATPEGLSEVEVQNRALKIFCGTDAITANSMRASDRDLIVAKLAEVFNTTPGLKRQFKIGDVTYGFIPNMDNITFGEYVDIEAAQADAGKLSDMVSILYRPIIRSYGERYEIAPYDPKAAKLNPNQIPADVAIGSSLFFWSIGIDLCNYTLRSLREAKTQRVKKTILSLLNQRSKRYPKSGDGLLQSIDYVQGILHELKKSPGSQYIQSFIGLLLKTIGTTT